MKSEIVIDAGELQKGIVVKQAKNRVVKQATKNRVGRGLGPLPHNLRRSKK